jgi:hypothetical protein
LRSSLPIVSILEKAVDDTIPLGLREKIFEAVLDPKERPQEEALTRMIDQAIADHRLKPPPSASKGPLPSTPEANVVAFRSVKGDSVAVAEPLSTETPQASTLLALEMARLEIGREKFGPFIGEQSPEAVGFMLEILRDPDFQRETKGLAPEALFQILSVSEHLGDAIEMARSFSVVSIKEGPPANDNADLMKVVKPSQVEEEAVSPIALQAARDAVTSTFFSPSLTQGLSMFVGRMREVWAEGAMKADPGMPAFLRVLRQGSHFAEWAMMGTVLGLRDLVITPLREKAEGALEKFEEKWPLIKDFGEKDRGQTNAGEGFSGEQGKRDRKDSETNVSPVFRWNRPLKNPVWIPEA